MTLLTSEFLLITCLLLVIFIVNISQIFYLIFFKSNRSIRGILMNSSFSSLILSIYLIPSFYFRTECSSDSFLWRLWSFSFHVIDAVQIYSLFLLLTTRSFEKLFIVLIWFIPTIAYSPILWLPSSNNELNYLPYRRLRSGVPWWILPIVYFSMYLIPMVISLMISIIYWICPWMDDESSRKNREKTIMCNHPNEHQKDMTELADLITTVMNFPLKETRNQSNQLKVIFLFSTRQQPIMFFSLLDMSISIIILSSMST